MPLLARQEGVWEGVYRCYDYHGNKVDEHASKLTCRLTPGSDSLDPDRLTLLLQWRRRDEPTTRFYEMIQVDDACRQRSRVWQWIRDGRIFLRTLIDEHKVADDWR